MRGDEAKDATPSRRCEGARRKERFTRLRSRSEFQAVYREGRRRSGQEFSIFCRANGLSRSRFGMSVKKSLGSAVTRNRIRRRIREILRQNFQEIAPGWDLVIHPRTSVARRQFAPLAQELVRLMRAASEGSGRKTQAG